MENIRKNTDTSITMKSQARWSVFSDKNKTKECDDIMQPSDIAKDLFGLYEVFQEIGLDRDNEID